MTLSVSKLQDITARAANGTLGELPLAELDEALDAFKAARRVGDDYVFDSPFYCIDGKAYDRVIRSLRRRRIGRTRKE